MTVYLQKEEDYDNFFLDEQVDLRYWRYHIKRYYSPGGAISLRSEEPDSHVCEKKWSGASGYRVSRKSGTRSDRVRNISHSALITVNSAELNRFERPRSNSTGSNLLTIFWWTHVSCSCISEIIKSSKHYMSMSLINNLAKYLFYMDRAVLSNVKDFHFSQHWKDSGILDLVISEFLKHDELISLREQYIY